MKTCIRTFALSALMASIAPFGLASERASAEDAVAMVKKAVSAIKANGKEKAFAEFSDPANKTYHDRDLYIYVYDMNGVAVAHGNNPRLVGKNLIDMKDVDGTLIIKSFIDVANSKGKGWVDYKWPNPLTKAVENKSGYVEKVENLVVGSGVYKP